MWRVSWRLKLPAIRYSYLKDNISVTRAIASQITDNWIVCSAASRCWKQTNKKIRITDYSCGESTGNCWIPQQKANDPENVLDT